MKLHILIFSALIFFCCASKKNKSSLNEALGHCNLSGVTFQQTIYGASIPVGFTANIDTLQKLVVFGDTSSVDNPMGVSWELNSVNRDEIFDNHYDEMVDDPLYTVIDSVRNKDYCLISYYSTDWETGDTLEGIKVYIQYENQLLRVKEIAGNKPIQKGARYCEVVLGLFNSDLK